MFSVEMVRKGLSVIPFAISLFMAATHPYFPVVATLLYFLYLIGLFKYPKAWVFLIFALLPLLDFGMWTGNIIYTEYDAFFLETFGFLLFNGKNKVRYPFKNELFFLCFLIFFIVSILIGFWPYFNGLNSYDVHISYWNSIRVGKGFLSAWIIWYFIRYKLVIDYKNTIRLLGYGVCAGLFCFSLLILWERHVISSLFFGFGIYETLSRVLDFSSTYRVTGFFSGMHVGGTAIDGYLVCALPLCFYVVSRQSDNYRWLLSASVFMLGIYCLIVTFTRMTMASCFLAILISLAMLSYQGRNYFEQFRHVLIKSVFVILLVLAGLVVCYLNSGYKGFAFGLLGVISVLLMVYVSSKVNFQVFLVGMLAVFFVGSYGIYDSIADSQWHQDVDFKTALLESIAFMVIFEGAGLFLGLRLKTKGIPLSVLRIPLVASIMIVFVIIGAMSTRMEERFKGVNQDMLTRKDHWLNVIDTRTPDSLSSSIFGEGMGAMARQYYAKYSNEKSLPSFTWLDDSGKTILKLGANGYPFHQKIPILPNTRYKLYMLIKSDSVGDNISVDICHKHILFSDSYQPGCVDTSFVTKAVTWERFEWAFNSGILGLYGWFDWPATLQIHNNGKNPIEIDSVEILDENGNNILRNSSFDKQLKYWFWTSDFEHLPWHSKQLFIHVWLEQGWLGVFLLSALILFAFKRQINLFLSGDSIPIALIPVLVGVICLGLTDTFIDEPQISLMVYAIFFAAMQWPRRVNQ